MLILSSCATLFQPEKVSMNIDLITVNVDEQPINAVCTLFSSSSKLLKILINDLSVFKDKAL